MSTVWLTYDELAERLGIERESARQHVKRKHWARQRGNDGKVRIGVPEEVLSARSEADTEGGTEAVQAPVQSLVQDPGVTAVLTRHIERLEEQLEGAIKRAEDRDDVAKERDLLIAQIEALNDSTKIQVDALRAALAAAERDRDRWHEVATVKPEHAAPAERRPWWRRLAG
jgi:predicted ArsR family transcriptional regulator